MKPSESFNRTNVTEAGLELSEKKPELRFDPQEEIRPEEWLVIEKFLNNLRSNVNASSLALNLGNVATLDHSRATLTSEDLKLLKDHLDYNRNIGDMYELLHVKSSLAKIDPTLFPVRDEKEWQTWLAYIPPSEKFPNHTLEQLARLDPSRAVVKPGHLKIMNNNILVARTNADITYWGTKIAVLAPELLRDLTTEQWATMHNRFEALRADPNRNMAEFIAQAANMTTISRALQKMQPSRVEDIPSVPETKSYSS